VSDRRIQELEREYRAGHDPHVGGQLLRLREQAGLLPPRAIEVLLLLQAPAAVALHPAPARRVDTWPALGEVLAGIRALNPEACARAVLAVQRRALSRFVAHAQDRLARATGEEVEGLREGLTVLSNYGATVLDEVRAWIHETSCTRPLELSVPGHRPRPNALRLVAGDPAGSLAALLYMVTLDEFDPRTRQDTSTPRGWERRLVEDPRFASVQPWTAGMLGDFVHTLNADLGPWAAGSSDPLASRPVDLEQALIASPCPVGWESMQGNDRVRTCSGCSRTVFDLSALTRDDAQALLSREGERICVRLFRRPDGRVQTQDCIPGLLPTLVNLTPSTLSFEQPFTQTVGSLVARRPGDSGETP